MIAGFCRKPLTIYLIAGCYIAIQAAALLLRTREADFQLDIASLMSSSVFWQELFCSVTAAIAIVIVSRYSLIYLIGLSIYFIGFKIYQFYGRGWDPSIDLAVVGFWFIAPLVFLTTKLRVPYTHPETRWWKRHPRFPHISRGTLYFHGIRFPILMMNLSADGGFVKLDERLFAAKRDMDNEERREHYSSAHPFMTPDEMLIARRSVDRFPSYDGDIIRIVVKTLPSLDNPYPNQLFEAGAKVCWVTQETDPVHYGLGLKFIEQSFWDKIRLRKYLHLFQEEKTEESVPS